MTQDLPVIIWWWVSLSIFGWVAWPLTKKIFGEWYDGGYLLAKAAGLGLTTFGVWILSTLHIVPFEQYTIWLVMGIVLLAGRFLNKGKSTSLSWRVIVAEEIFFGAAIIFWSWIKAHEPTINGLEKFMDYGFTNSILRTKFFPPRDMWFAGGWINYYFFGHLAMAMVTRLSGLPLGYGFNLMLVAIFAWCATISFSIGRQLLNKWWGAVLIAFLDTLGGNLQTIYAFTKGYNGEDTPPPFWTIWSNMSNWKEGMLAYWYPNATRFIPYTIHEFPSYSFVVSDVHGHVLDIPFALLAIAMLVNMFGREREKISFWEYAAYGVNAGWMFMTNALDGPIYIGLFGILYVARNFQIIIKKLNFQILKPLIVVAVIFGLTVAPFVVNFKSFVSGLAVNCPPAGLVDSKVGPFLFETVDKCQKSPIWMMLVLWGFFVYNAVWLWVKEPKNKFFHVISLFCLGLIIFPEFFYFKDIYPLHFRSNTMFKLGYQVFILMAMVSGYTIVKMFSVQSSKFKMIFFIGLTPLLFLVAIYPRFSVNSYFGNLKTYQEIYGLKWLQTRYPDDWEAIKWLNSNIPNSQQPVVLEANGDSYTDYDRISTFTGLPTVAGWTVHEWLWRGGYDPIAKRAEEVRQVYESDDLGTTKSILAKYEVKYIVVGGMERQKYPKLDEKKIESLGKQVFSSGTTAIYKII